MSSMLINLDSGVNSITKIPSIHLVQFDLGSLWPGCRLIVRCWRPFCRMANIQVQTIPAKLQHSIGRVKFEQNA